MIEPREGRAADREAILALRARAFPGEDAEKQDPRFWEWEFGRGRFFVAEDGGRAVAHLGFVPQTYFVNGEKIPALMAVDAMTDPEYRRQHLFSRVVAFARDAIRDSVRISTAWQIRDAVLPAMTRGGWKPMLRASVLVRPLSVKAIFASGAAGSQPAERERRAESPPLHSALVMAGGHGDRSEAFFRWRFLENPCWQYDVDADDDAYVVTRRTTLRGLDSLAIADLGWRPRCERQARMLLRQAIGRGRDEGAQVAAVLLTLGHPALPLLVRSGFLPSPHRFRFLLNAFGAPLAGARWGLTWADTDHL